MTSWKKCTVSICQIWLKWHHWLDSGNMVTVHYSRQYDIIGCSSLNMGENKEHAINAVAIITLMDVINTLPTQAVNYSLNRSCLLYWLTVTVNYCLLPLHWLTVTVNYYLLHLHCHHKHTTTYYPYTAHTNSQLLPTTLTLAHANSQVLPTTLTLPTQTHYYLLPLHCSCKQSSTTYYPYTANTNTLLPTTLTLLTVTVNYFLLPLHCQHKHTTTYYPYTAHTNNQLLPTTLTLPPQTFNLYLIPLHCQHKQSTTT